MSQKKFSFITSHSLPNCVATVIIHLCPWIILFSRQLFLLCDIIVSIQDVSDFILMLVSVQDDDNYVTTVIFDSLLICVRVCVCVCARACMLDPIDHMHMTSQKGAHLRWGSNRGTATCVIAKHAARCATPACHTERLSANAHCQHNTCALRDTSLASLLWRCDPLWRQCIRSIIIHVIN